MSSELITLLEREAAAEREQVLTEARAQAAAVTTEAKRQADEMLTAHKERLATEAKAALVKAQSTAQLRAASLVLKVKDEAITTVFSGAEAELSRLVSNGQRYPVALRMFIEEGLRGFPGRAIVAVNPADQSIAQALVKERGWEVTIQADPAVQGGARISSPDGRLVVTNTLTSRLDRARPMLTAEVAGVLWPRS